MKSSNPDVCGDALFCGYCGERLPDLGDGLLGACPTCKKSYGRKKTVKLPPPPPPPSHDDWLFHQSMYSTHDPRFKDPVLAALFSAVLPGAGQLYNAQFLKGLLIFITCWLVIPYFLGIFDAYVTAEKSNRWQAMEAGRRLVAVDSGVRSY